MKKIVLGLIVLVVLIGIVFFIQSSNSETFVTGETLITPADSTATQTSTPSSSTTTEASTTPTSSETADIKSKFEVLQESASKGNAKAQNELGNMFATGSAPVQSDNEALKWFEKSANQGYAEAQYNLGTMYQNAIGVDQDFKKAVKYYKLAAAQGHAEAKNNLEALCEEDSTLCK
ncbi:MAG: tetratricopeptide repeat protein [Aliarcobacter sp.]|nr:tetratricopeptide repeat protein [Aliarcobacter sp.]